MIQGLVYTTVVRNVFVLGEMAGCIVVFNGIEQKQDLLRMPAIQFPLTAQTRQQRQGRDDYP